MECEISIINTVDVCDLKSVSRISQIIFLHVETFNAMIDLRIADGFSKINLLQHVTKLERSCFRIYFISLSGFESMVIALFCFFKLSKYLFQASFADSLFCFRSDFYFACLLVLR